MTDARPSYLTTSTTSAFCPKMMVPPGRAMMNGLSFKTDYSELVPINQDFEENTSRLKGRAFLFDGTEGSAQEYGAFRLRIADRTHGLSDGLLPIELKLWAFDIEGRRIVCAVTQYFRRDAKRTSVGAIRFRYIIEAINVDCLHHKADIAITTADRQMFSRVIRKMLPDYHRAEFKNRPELMAAPIEIIERWDDPNPQIASFLDLTTHVAWDADAAERRVEGIDSFFQEGWRSRYDFVSDNNFNVRFGAPPIEDISSFSVKFDGFEFIYNYKSISEKVGQKVFFSTVLFTPWSPNSLEASVIRGSKSSITDEIRERADRYARFSAFKDLRASRGKYHRQAPLSVVLVSGAL